MKASDVTKKKQTKKAYILIGVIMYLIFLYAGLHISSNLIINPDGGIVEAISAATTNMFLQPFNIVIGGKTVTTLIVMSLVFGVSAFYLSVQSEKFKHDRNMEENGSARWTDDYDEYNKTYTDPPGSKDNNGPNNMILTQNVFLNMDTRKTLRNNNVLVVGGSGAGKSRFMVKPNLLQANCNYVVTDPAGELLSTTGQFLVNQGYDVKVFNLVEMAKSDQYNPFNYIRDDLGVLMMINCLIKNTNPDGKSGGDPFWEKSETALLQALCFYLIKYCPKHQQNFTSVMKLLRAAEVDENNPAMKSKLDRIFDEVASRDPNSIALKQYLTFKMGAGRTLKSILISCSVRLTVFNMREIESLTKIDTIDLASMGTGKKALFVIIPAADSTYNFLVSMMYSQLFETLYFVAETQCPGQRLERPIRFLLDEFANIGQIPEFTKKLATMRKYEISCTVILQNLAQIKTMYKDDWESIVGNCDSFLFLGGSEATTLEYISKKLGKETIRVKAIGTSIGKQKSGNVNINRSGRELMTPDELSNMSTNECVLMIRGLHPFWDKKYDYVKHPNYKLTGDADKSLLYINTRNNREIMTSDQLAIEYEKQKAKQYAKAQDSPNPKDKPFGPPMTANVMSSMLSINNASDMKKNLIITGPEDIKEVKKPKKIISENEPSVETNSTFKNDAKNNETKRLTITEEPSDTSNSKKTNSNTSETSSSEEVWTF
jgi:type IV secretion system protein VirD4